MLKGKYKVPMLRGPVDSGIETYAQLDSRLREDVDNWVGNLYISFSHLPRTMGGKREHEDQLQRTSRLLGREADGNNNNSDPGGKNTTKKTLDISVLFCPSACMTFVCGIFFQFILVSAEESILITLVHWKETSLIMFFNQ